MSIAEDAFVETNDMFDERDYLANQAGIPCLICTEKQTPLHKLSFAWLASFAETSTEDPFLYVIIF